MFWYFVSLLCVTCEFIVKVFPVLSTRIIFLALLHHLNILTGKFCYIVYSRVTLCLQQCVSVADVIHFNWFWSVFQILYYKLWHTGTPWSDCHDSQLEQIFSSPLAADCCDWQVAIGNFRCSLWEMYSVSATHESHSIAASEHTEWRWELVYETFSILLWHYHWVTWIIALDMYEC